MQNSNHKLLEEVDMSWIYGEVELAGSFHNLQRNFCLRHQAKGEFVF